MRNLIIVISVLFVAIIAVSYFYFSNLSEGEHPQPPANASEEVGAAHTAPVASTGLVWTYDLNGGAITRPSIWSDDDSTRFILVQDAYHILHAISPDGQKRWNAQLPGPIVDSISQLPDRSLVFTTTERLYRIDTQGDPLPGFSVQLPQRATQGATAIRQPADGTVRIDVGTSRQLLSYDGRGKLLRRQTRSTRASDQTQPTDRTLTGLPHECGPLAHTGPLYPDGLPYLLCGKSDGKLHCFRY